MSSSVGYECPINGGQDHRYFCFKTYTTYEPVPIEKVVYRADYPDMRATQLYEKVELAILSCNCGSTVSKRVHEDV